MANISSVGIGSGVLTSDLIEKLAEAERAPTEARLDRREEDLSAELSIFGQIQSAITDLRLPSRSLSDGSLFESKIVTSGNSAFSGSASSTAVAGSYSLEVTALAKSQTLTSSEFNDSDTTQLGEGSLSIKVGTGAAVNVAISAANNTLDGIAAAINESSDLDVTASVLYTGTGYKLVLNSDKTGLANTVEIAVTDTGDGDDDDANGLSRLSYTAGALNLSQSQPATDAAFELNGVPITRSSNTVGDAIPGVTLTLNSTNIDVPASLTVENDSGTISEKITEFVDAYNSLKKLISDNSNFDPSGANNGILLGDTSTRTILNEVQNILGSTIKGLESANVRSLAEIGIATDYQTGQLSFNSSTFETQFAAYPDDVAALFSEQRRASDSQVEMTSSSINTKPGTYAINVTTAATRGDVTGSVSLGASTTIDANNDALTIKIDGTDSGAITLEAGSYTQAQLATELQSKINADSTLAAAGKFVTVTLDGSNQLVINSGIYGSSSKVELTSVDTNSVAQLGLSVGVGTDGVDVVGTINGVAATGSGQVLTAASGDDSEGIKVKISGSAIGSRGTATYIEGVGEQLVDTINRFLGTDGTITAKNERINKELALIAGERISLSERIESLTSRLAKQFTAADILISQLNSTQDFIKSQLDALSGASSKD